MGEALRKVHEEHGLSEGVLKGLAPPSWVAWALEQPGETGRRRPTVDELAAHDGESTTPRKAQHKLGETTRTVHGVSGAAASTSSPAHARKPMRRKRV